MLRRRNLSGPPPMPDQSARLHGRVLAFALAWLAFLGGMAWAEQHGLSRNWIGPVFLFASVMVYAAVGIAGRTTDPDEYYVAGRRIPPIYNGMATAADWVSAASFISLAGALYLQGFGGTAAQPGGLAYVLGWTGGFCLVGLLIAPQLRRMAVYTVPDYFGVRFGGRWPRRLAALATVLCSFSYVIAQIYGIGLIASRLTGVQFEIGILLGLGGVLLCSFLGGMRAITWTQVAQYIVLLLAFLVPVSWLAYKQLGTPLAPLAYGVQLPKIAALETHLTADPSEQAVREVFRQRAAAYAERLVNVEKAMADERASLQAQLQALRTPGADLAQVLALRRALADLPRDAASARERWQRARDDNLERAKPLGGLPRHSQAYPGDPHGSASEREAFSAARLNFLALMFCLMAGTASLPHLLTRFFTVPSVAAARSSVAWSLLFIALVYLSVPALAVLVKYEVMQHLVGTRYDALPGWIAQWARVDPSLISVADVNGDGRVQFGELRLGADIVMLATPELAGLPFVVSGLVAAGGIAAALSTADGLLLTISNALVHDLRRRGPLTPLAAENRVIVSKFTLFAVALVAALVASWKPAEIIALITASFSLAASAFFPALVMGIWWRSATARGAIAGMLTGLGVTLACLLGTHPSVRAWLGWLPDDALWGGIHPVSAGVFGVPAGAAAMAIVSTLERRIGRARRRREIDTFAAAGLPAPGATGAKTL